MPSVFQFNCRKAVQAVAFLLRQSGVDQGSYLKLLKLLYIAERESLLETGHPLTGDKMCAMPHGAALSHICDLMRGEDSNPEWGKFIERDRYKLRLMADPGDDLLCPYEVAKLTEVSDRHRGANRWALKALTHELPEYKKNDPGESSKDIPIEDVLEAGGKSRSLSAMRRAAHADITFSKIFGG